MASRNVPNGSKNLFQQIKWNKKFKNKNIEMSSALRGSKKVDNEKKWECEFNSCNR